MYNTSNLYVHFAWMRFFILKPLHWSIQATHHHRTIPPLHTVSEGDLDIHLLLSSDSNVVIIFCFHNWIFNCDTALAPARHIAFSALTTHRIPSN